MIGLMEIDDGEKIFFSPARGFLGHIEIS